MKDRGKAVEAYNNDFVQNYSTSSSDLFCKKHPQSSSVGICAFCLKDRLSNLVCSDCGEEKRSSSCSCSEVSSNPRTSCTGEVGSVGRVSFLIENENNDQQQSLLNLTSKSKAKTVGDKSEDVFFLKRSNSSCVEIKRKKGFWRFGKLFRKKRDKDKDMIMNMNEKNDMWVVDYNGVSRSRSLCSFRGGGFFGSEDGGDSMNFSGARSSSISAARSSSVMGGLSVDPDRKSGFSEPRKSGFSEPRKSGFDSDKRDSSFVESYDRRMFSLKESYFSGGDDSGFIDLKFEFQSETKGVSDTPAFGSMRAGGGGSNSIQNVLVGGGSCRVTVNERGIKSRKSFKVWRWIFRHNSEK